MYVYDYNFVIFFNIYLFFRYTTFDETVHSASKHSVLEKLLKEAKKREKESQANQEENGKYGKMKWGAHLIVNQTKHSQDMDS